MKAIIIRVTKGKNKGQFRFKLVGFNGEAIAQSHPETYKNLVDCEATLDKYFSSFQKQYTKNNLTREQFIK